MTQIILPIAGKAQRFVDQGYRTPKPLLRANNVPMIQLSVNCLLNCCDGNPELIFIVLREHIEQYQIDSILGKLFPKNVVKVVVINKVTEGALCTCLKAKEYVTDDMLIVYTPDIYFESDFNLKDFNSDGLLLTFKANSPAHSYALNNDLGEVTKIAEKSVISNTAIVGVYCMDSGRKFMQYAEKAVQNGVMTNNEYYIAPMYNLLIDEGMKVTAHQVKKIHVLGTPEDLDFYKKTVVRYQNIKNFALCCDHSGYHIKEKLIEAIKSLGYEHKDFGSHNAEDSDHYDSLKPCIEYMNSTNAFGIGICNTGQGFNIAANKVNGVRSALVYDGKSAEMARRHNAANFFCLPASSINIENIRSILESIVKSTFDGGRHTTRIQRIENDKLFIK